MSLTEASETPWFVRRRWAIVAIYLIVCIALAVLHHGLMFGWLAKIPRGAYELLLPIGGPSLSLNTHMSVLLFIPLSGLLVPPLLIAVRASGLKRMLASVLFAAGWLGSGAWLARLF